MEVGVVTMNSWQVPIRLRSGQAFDSAALRSDDRFKEEASQQVSGGIGLGLDLSKDGGKGMEEAGVGELESRSGEFGGVGAGAGEEDFVGHFAESEAKGKGWNREKGRTVELGGEGAGELIVRNRVGGGDVDGAGDAGRVEKEEDAG